MSLLSQVAAHHCVRVKYYLEESEKKPKSKD
jgi:hypothetical protein